MTTALNLSRLLTTPAGGGEGRGGVKSGLEGGRGEAAAATDQLDEGER